MVFTGIDIDTELVKIPFVKQGQTRVRRVGALGRERLQSPPDLHSDELWVHDGEHGVHVEGIV